MEIKSFKIKKPEEINLILGQSHFIKTVEDLYEVLVNNVPGIKFGLAFVESSGACKVRCEGTDLELKNLAAENALEIGAGHTFIIFLRNAYPINVLNAIKNIPEVCNIFCATANQVEVVVAENTDGARGVLGVVDGAKPKGIEEETDISWRKGLLRKIGYKL
ncbi:MAG: adenosine-specific kinase [Candidatus Omnitrophica bacterium]|nr:adenosine-specific kinase [Candidatus Omnitrophota bacterium]